MRRIAASAFIALLLLAAPAAHAVEGLTSRPSRNSVDETIKRFEAAVRAAGWVVFGEVDHAAAAHAVGMELARRTVIMFGNPRTGTPAMAAHPTLALDLPMRVLVWQDGGGHVYITRSTGAFIATQIFARNGVTLPASARKETEAFLFGLVRKAVE
jgi:uncharacterized protein (DUF302 family)